MEQNSLEKLIGSQLLKQFPTFLGTRMSNYCLTRARHRNLHDFNSLSTAAFLTLNLIQSAHLSLGLGYCIIVVSKSCEHVWPLWESELRSCHFSLRLFRIMFAVCQMLKYGQGKKIIVCSKVWCVMWLAVQQQVGLCLQQANIMVTLVLICQTTRCYNPENRNATVLVVYFMS
jgi:hypothetical protein